MQKVRSVFTLLIFASVLALCLPLFDIVYLYPSTTRLLIEQIQQDAEELGIFLAASVPYPGDAEQLAAQLQQLQQTFDLQRVSLRSPSGEVLYSTDPRQVGHRRDLDLLRRQLRRGVAYSRIFHATVEGRETPASLIETQAPILVANDLVAVLELTHDISGFRDPLDRSVSHASIFLLLVAAVLLATILSVFRLARQAFLERQLAAEQLLESQQALQQQNRELNSLFAQVEQAKHEWQMSLDCITDMILLVDEQDRVRRCNEALIRFVGRPYLAVLGKNWKTVLFAEGVEVLALNQQHSEIYHPRHQVWLRLEFYRYHDQQGGRLTVIRIQQQRERGKTG